MKQERAIDLDGGQYRTLKRIIEIHIPHKEVWAYGSRVKWKASIGADLDLVVFDCDLFTVASFREALEESNLVISVDIMNWEKIPDDFKENIKKKYTVLQKKSLSEEWREVRLGDIGKFSGGVSSIKKDDYGHGYPFLQYTNVYKNWKVDINNLEMMNVRKSDLISKNCIYGDIFFTASSETEDEVAISSVLLDEVENLTYNAFCKRFRLFNFETLLPEFAKYLFRSKAFRNKVYQLVTGDIRFNISQASLASIRLTIPSLLEQEIIAEALSSLDDKINLFRRQNKTLETTAQTLFHEKITNNPSCENWEKVSLGDSVLSQILNSRIKEFEGKKIYYATADIQGDIIVNKGVMINYNERPARANMQPAKFSVWFAKKGGSRKILMFNDHSDNTDDIILSTGFSGLKTNKLSHYYIWCYISGMEFQKTKDNRVSGTVQPDINNDGINDIQILNPDEDVLKEFNNKVESLFLKIQHNVKRIRALENLRDMLLPKLLNGKIILKAKS